MTGPKWVVVFLLTTFAVYGQEYQPVDKEKSITFRIKNFGITVDGSFRGLSGTIHFDPQQPEQGKVDLWVDATTVDTGIKLRNNHIKKKEYLDVESFPRITIKSTGMKAGDKPQTGILMANLTIKGTSRAVTIPFNIDQTTPGAITFIGEIVINRRDYGVGGGSLSMADTLTIAFRVDTVSK